MARLSAVGNQAVLSCGNDLLLETRHANTTFVVANWDKLSNLKGLCIYFVNPKLNEKWLLYPFTHNQITERSALKRGLESLFSMVPAC